MWMSFLNQIIHSELLYNLSTYPLATTEVPPGVQVPLFGNHWSCWHTQKWGFSWCQSSRWVVSKLNDGGGVRCGHTRGHFFKFLPDQSLSQLLIIAWTVNDLSDALLDFWQVRNLMTCLQFEQFHSLISHISALRRDIIHCSQLVLKFLQSYFTCCGWIWSGQKLNRGIKLNCTAKQTEHIGCIFQPSVAPK